ncbi:MAG: hypothetical protein H7Y88_03835 [Phycisphaerales bacterium]|nr:hypothetical protein [Phycisphaerales bacterium]
MPDLGDVLDANVPLPLQQAIHTIFMEEYRLTNADVRRRYGAEEGHDVEPHLRRANIESRLGELEQIAPGLVKVHVGQNRSGNSFRFLECGSLILTQSYVEPGSKVPREAAFRNSFAGNLNQPRLFAPDEAERVAQVQALEKMYSIITHTPSPHNPAEPSHISVVFVDAACRFVASIDLAERIALNVARAVKVEVVTDRAQSRLRRDVAVLVEKKA